MRLLTTLTALLTLTACTTPQPQPLPPLPPSTTPTPPTPGLVITLGATDAAMGLRSLDIQLTNNTGAPAQINGYPDIRRVLDTNLAPIETTIGHGTNGVAVVDSFDTPPHPVTLQPGGTAHAALLWRNRVTETDRKATLGAYLVIAPTPDAAPQTVEPHGGVDLGNTTTLGVSAWKTRTP